MPEVVWLLLRAVRDLVAEHCGGSTSEAEQLTIEYAQKGHFTTCRFHGDKTDKLILPRHWGAMHPEVGLCIPVDFDNSTVTYMRGAPSSETAKLKMEEVDEKLEQVLELPPPVFQMRLVRLSRDQVFSMLRMEGLLELSGEQPSIPAKLSAAKEHVKARVKAQRLGPQERRIEAAALVIYGDDWPMLRPAELQRDIDNALKAGTLKALRPPLPRHWVAPLDSCTRILEKRGKLRAN